MRAVPLPGVLACAAVASLITACDPPPCPAGSHEEMGRCIADSDAAIDAGPLDAFAQPLDAWAPPDACALVDLFEDRDRDGHGDPARPIRACAVGSGIASSSDDCDDDAASTHPGATELCNGADEDCDEAFDEGIQRTIGAPRVVAMESANVLAAIGTGGSFLVAHDEYEGPSPAMFFERYDRDGARLITRTLFHSCNTPAFFRLYPVDEMSAVAWFPPGESPGRLFGGIVDTTTLDGAASDRLGTESAQGAAFASGDEHVVVFPAGDLVLALAFERTTMMPIGGGVMLPVLRDQPRSAFATDDGTMLFHAVPEGLDVHHLPPGAESVTSVGRIELEGLSAIPMARDPSGRYTALAGTAEAATVVRFREADLSAVPVPFTAEPFALGTPVGMPRPEMLASRAGADFAIVVVTASGAQIEWHHFDASGGPGTVTVLDSPHESIFAVAIARLSTRRGAVFFSAYDAAAGSTIWMQPIGCE